MPSTRSLPHAAVGAITSPAFVRGRFAGAALVWRPSGEDAAPPADALPVERALGAFA